MLQEVIDLHTDPWGVKVTQVAVKAVDLPQEMQRAMAKQAESEREKRAKIIHASGELEASKQLAEAASALSAQPVSLHLRYLQTLVEIAAEKNSTIIFPVPIDWMKALMGEREGLGDGGAWADPAEDEGLILRGSLEETIGSRAAPVRPGKRGDRRPHLPQGRRHEERPPAHGPRRLRALAATPTSASGEDLLLRGKITVRQYLEASRLIAPGRRLGTILVELGALEPEDLIGAIEHHVKEILLDVFTWTTGEYELVMTEPGKDDVVALNLSDREP